MKIRLTEQSLMTDMCFPAFQYLVTGPAKFLSTTKVPLGVYLSCNSHSWWVTLRRTVLLCYSKESFLIYSEDFFSHCNFLSGFVVDVFSYLFKSASIKIAMGSKYTVLNIFIFFYT